MSGAAAHDLTVAVLGLGEAGGRIAADLAELGVDVRGWDPASVAEPAGVRLAGGPEAAVEGSDVVLSLNAAAAAVEALRSVEPALSPGRLYADMNTASPALKLELAGMVAPSGALFADVALLTPVLRHGARTPSLASGPGAPTFAKLFGALGMPVEVIDDEPGSAAALKLVRSVFMKGIAAAALESLRAASELGRAEWMRGEIAEALDGPGAPLLERLLDGSRQHAVRRADEMEAASELLRELGVEPRIAAATAACLAELARETGATRSGAGARS